jgi:hypothetical protein
VALARLVELFGGASAVVGWFGGVAGDGEQGACRGGPLRGVEGGEVRVGECSLQWRYVGVRSELCEDV